MAESVQIVVEAQDLASNVLKTIAGVLTGDLASAGLAATAVFAGIVAELADLTKAAAGAEVSQARFNSLVDASPLADYKETMLGFADSLSKVTRFEDENILEAEGMLATYQKIGKEVFPQALNATLDLAEFMKTDATSAAETLGRAFSDISNGSLTMLYRQKLLTAAQKDQAEAMAKGGDAAGAQAFVLDILNGKIGNLAETMGDTFQGKMTIFENTIGNLKEALGEKLLPVLGPIIDKLTELAITYTPMLADAFIKYVIPAVSGAVDIFGKFLDMLTGSNQAFSNERGWDGKVGFFENLSAEINNIDWKQISDDLKKGIDEIDWAGLGILLREKLIEWNKEFDPSEFTKNFDLPGIAVKIVTGLAEALASAVTGSRESVGNIAKTWSGIWEQAVMFDWQVKKIATDKIKEFAVSIMNILPSIGAEISSNIIAWNSDITAALSEIGATFYARFLAAGQYAINAINNIKTSVINAVKAFVNAVKAAISDIQINIRAILPDFAKVINDIKNGIAAIKSAISSAGSIGIQVGAGVNLGGAGSKKGDGLATGTGGWQTVPAGYPDDTYPIRLTSGEKYAVIPAGGSMPSGGGAGGGGMQVVINYAPTFSTASRDELLNNIRPLLDNWYRQRLAA